MIFIIVQVIIHRYIHHHHHHCIIIMLIISHSNITFIHFHKKHLQIVEPTCGDHLTHSLDLVTTLRSELAASTYKRDRLIAEVNLNQISSIFFQFKIFLFASAFGY